jgi:hypothetical protein
MTKVKARTGATIFKANPLLRGDTRLGGTFTEPFLAILLISTEPSFENAQDGDNSIALGTDRQGIQSAR